MRRTITAIIAAAALVPLSAGVAGAESESTGTWFDGLEPGVCFNDVWLPSGDFDFDTAAAIVPCADTHDSEVVARIALGDVYPQDDIIARVDDECLLEQERFLGKPIGSSLMYPFNVAPSVDEWEAGVREALCMIYGGEPVVGTAASGSLRAAGETIAAYREVDGVPDVWLIDAGTGEAVQNITANDRVKLVTSPSWTPDGTAIAVSYEAGAAKEESDVYLVSLADGTEQPILDTPAGEDGVVVSPDGSMIAFISDAPSGEFDIFTQDLTTGAVARLTDHADRDSSPQWSPDGSVIAFRRRTDDVSDIWTMAADGSDQQRLTDNGGNNYDPRWSPDGSRIAFTVNLGSNYDIGLMNADGSGQTLLTTHPADDEFPTWSSDGSVVAFHSSRHGGVSLWLMNADGSEASELTGLAPVGFAMFSPVAEG